MFEYHLDTRELVIPKAVKDVIDLFIEHFDKEMGSLYKDFKKILANQQTLLQKIGQATERIFLSLVVQKGTKKLAQGGLQQIPGTPSLVIDGVGILTSVLVCQLLRTIWKRQDEARQSKEEIAKHFFETILELQKKEHDDSYIKRFFISLFSTEKNKKEMFDKYKVHVRNFAIVSLRYVFIYLANHSYSNKNEDLATLARFMAENACELLFNPERQPQYFPKDDEAISLWIRRQLIPPEGDPSFYVFHWSKGKKLLVKQFHRRLHCVTPYLGNIKEKLSVQTKKKNKLIALVQKLSESVKDDSPWTLEGIFHHTLLCTYSQIYVNPHKYSWKYPVRFLREEREYPRAYISARQIIGGILITGKDDRPYYTSRVFQEKKEFVKFNESLLLEIKQLWKQLEKQSDLTTDRMLEIRNKKYFYRYQFHTFIVNFDIVKQQARAKTLADYMHKYIKYMFLEYYTQCHIYNNNIQVVYDPKEALLFANEYVWLSRIYSDVVKTYPNFTQLFRKELKGTSVSPYQIFILLQRISEYQLQQSIACHASMPNDYQVYNVNQNDFLTNSLMLKPDAIEDSIKELIEYLNQKIKKAHDPTTQEVFQSYRESIAAPLITVQQILEIREVEIDQIVELDTCSPLIQELLAVKRKEVITLRKELKDLYSSLFYAGLIYIGSEEIYEKRQILQDLLLSMIQNNFISWHTKIEETQHTLLHTACACANYTTEIVDALLRQVKKEETEKQMFFNLNKDPQFIAYNGSTILHSAALSGNQEVFELIFRERKEIEVNQQNNVITERSHCPGISQNSNDSSLQSYHGCRTVLHIVAQSASSKKLEIMQFLIEKGADITLPDQSQSTALHLLLLKVKHLKPDDVCRFIELNAKKPVVLNKPDMHGNTPLHIAVEKGLSKNIIGALITDVNVQLKRNDNYIPVHIGILHHASLAILELLLPPIIPIHYSNRWWKSDMQPLAETFQLSLQKNSQEICDYVANQIAHYLPDLEYAQGRTSLHLAVIYANRICIEKILRAAQEKSGNDFQGFLNKEDAQHHSTLFYICVQLQERLLKPKKNDIIILQDNLTKTAEFLRDKNVKGFLIKNIGSAKEINFEISLPSNTETNTDEISFVMNSKKITWRIFNRDRVKIMRETILKLTKGLQEEINKKFPDADERKKLEDFSNQYYDEYKLPEIIADSKILCEQKNFPQGNQRKNHDGIVLMMLLFYIKKIEENNEEHICEVINTISLACENARLLMKAGAKDSQDLKSSLRNVLKKEIEHFLKDHLLNYQIKVEELKESLKLFEQLQIDLAKTIPSSSKSLFQRIFSYGSS